MVYNNVLDAMGQTPVIQLNKMVDEDSARVLVKYEGLNVGGSIKTRTAYNMIRQGEKDGIIKPDTIIVEPTSGNQGIGLALIGAVKGYKTIIIMPDSVSVERRKLVHHYGAEVILIHDDGNIGECIAKCVETAKKMAEENPKVYVPEQFSNPANPMVHRRRTALEIMEQVEDPIDGFCSGIGTGGTVSGMAKRLKELNPKIKVLGVEPAESPLLTQGVAAAHKIQGIGANFVPKTLDKSLIDKIVDVRGDDAIKFTREAAKKDGLLVGISSGAVLKAALELDKKIFFEGRDEMIVCIFPDNGERYLSGGVF